MSESIGAPLEGQPDRLPDEPARIEPPAEATPVVAADSAPLTDPQPPLAEVTATQPQSAAECSDSPAPASEELVVECCPFCNEPYQTGEAPPGYEWYCTWCDERLTDSEEVERNVAISHKFALAGLLLLVPAFTLTMLSVEQFGARTDAGLVSGVITLFRSGEIFLGMVIGLLSGVFPCLKLLGMVLLTSKTFIRVKHHRLIYRAVELSGKWGMIDVFLAAVMIYGFKFSTMFNISPKPGIVAFTAMVICNLLATWFFDTRIYRRRFHVK